MRPYPSPATPRLLSLTLLATILFGVAACGGPPPPATPAPPTGGPAAPPPPTPPPPPEPPPPVAPAPTEPPPTAAPTPEVQLLLTRPGEEQIPVGREIAIVAQVTPPQRLDLSWEISGTADGQLDTETGEQVIYTARQAGTDVVSVRGSAEDGTPIEARVVIEAVQPVVAALPPLTDIFPQARDGGEAFRFFNEPGSFTANISSDEGCRYSGQRGLAIAFEFPAGSAGNGGWGVHWDFAPAGHFDASAFSAFTFLLEGDAPGDFQIAMRDTAGKEVWVNTESYGSAAPDTWQAVEIPLARFADEGVDVASLQNVSFGFNRDHGEGAICVDEIAFK